MSAPREVHPPTAATGLVVAIESSTRRASVAVAAGADVRWAELESERAHASDLVPTLDRLVREAGAHPRSLAAVIVGTGPGSYTGLRVGLATAIGLARASGARILGVPSGEAQCAAVCRPGEAMSLLLDARSGEIYFARYRRAEDGGEVEVLEAPCVLTPAAARERVGRGEPVCGDATVADVVGLDADARARLVVDRPPDAATLLGLGRARLARGIESRLETIEPLYLRPFVATERKR